jgi:5-methylthioadenosine/S-adenosylhomocysteine deaminase
MDRETCALGTELVAGEPLLTDVTTVQDMYFHPDATHEAAVRVGLGHVAGPICFDFRVVDCSAWQAPIDFARSWLDKLQEIGGPEVPLFLMPQRTYTHSPEHCF